MTDAPIRPDTIAARQAVFATLALATSSEVAAMVASIWADAGSGLTATDLRAPEIGLVMLRGRIGGDGAPFNVGEATVARAAVRLSTGEVGHGYRLGRDMAAARNSAIIDALWQTSHRVRIEPLLAAINARVAAERDTASRMAASSRVDFFTLARETT